jgi:hypothetical protein
VKGHASTITEHRAATVATLRGFTARSLKWEIPMGTTSMQDPLK